MSDATGQHRRAGWGLPRRGRGDVAGASWEGEGQQARPEPPARGRGWRALAVVAFGALLAGGALLLVGGDDDPVTGLTDPEARSTEDVEVGSCLASLPSDGGQSLDVVPCEQQHLGEVVEVVELDDGAWPGDVEVLRQAREACSTAFADYVGIRLEDSELGLQPVVPRENDWRLEGDRTAVCVAEGPALVGSVRGTTQ